MKEAFNATLKDGTKIWFLPDGMLHRDGGPAFIRPDGYKAWFRDGFCHRADGPAVEHPDGTREWYRNGRKHREDGPAVKNAGGSQEWWLDGEPLDENVFQDKMATASFSRGLAKPLAAPRAAKFRKVSS